MEKTNYTLGRGKVHFSRFLPNTRTPAGFRYIGNTPEFNLTIESEDLDHFSSDFGVREKDDGVTLEVNRSGTMITDQISAANVALFFFGDDFSIATLATSGQSFTVEDVQLGRSYFIGATQFNPLGVRGIDPTTVVVGDSVTTPATGMVNFTGNPADADTVTIDGQVYEFVTALTGAYDVLIGVSAAATAANLAAAINLTGTPGAVYGVGTAINPDVSAIAAPTNVTLTAKVSGTVGNAITLTESGTNTNVSGATLTGGTGTAGVTYTPGVAGDYLINTHTGMLTILDTGTITEGSDVVVSYSLLESTRTSVISGTKAVEGALFYEANNPKGDNIDYYMGYVNIRPNGDYALKGDEWQQIPFTIEILKPENTEAILSQGRPVYV